MFCRRVLKFSAAAAAARKGTLGFGTATGESRVLLDGKVAIITGGSSGIGAATARLFTQHGAKVVIGDIQDEQGRQLSFELGPNSDYVHCDVTKESDVSGLVDFAVAKYNKLDVMFNNAGIAGAQIDSLSPIADLDMNYFDRIYSVNLRGVVLGVKHAARVMIPKKTGAIINTSSITAVQAVKTVHAYTITKHGVIGVTKTVASELSKYGIRVNCISPSTTLTPLSASTLGESHTISGATVTLDELLAKNSELYGVKLEPVDIARSALFLGSDEARFISGHNLIVDGSFSISKRFNPFQNPHD